MCGFAGYIDFTGLKPEAKSTINKMTDQIIHRGPDDCGIWLDQSLGIVLGHRRLAIIDLSGKGHQPMESFCGRFIIAFNGEIYNHLELKKEIDQQSIVNWKGHCDTEILLAAIAIYGLEKALAKCVGMFAFALWDKKEKKLILARDRLGEKPVYYGWLKGQFVFASEMSALFYHPNWQGKIDHHALSLLIRHSYIGAPHSIFKNIYKLKPGKILVLNYQSQKTEIKNYWNPVEVFTAAQNNSFAGSKEQAAELLKKLLLQSIKNQMIADVPIGSFLSGGIDSSTITALMQSISQKPINTFSIGFQSAEFNEAVYAKKVANHLKTNHTELYLSADETLKIIPQLPKIYSEPFSDSSQIPTFLIAKLARQSVKVCLSGDGGDELFCGYSRYQYMSHFYNRINSLPHFFKKSLAQSIQLFSPNTLNLFAKPFLSLMPQKYLHKNIGQKLHKLSHILNLKDQNQIYHHLISHYQNIAEILPNIQESKTLFTGLEKLPQFNDFTRKMMFLDLISYLPEYILTKVDRASMAVNLESRIPFLDHQVVEFAMTLPLAILNHNQQSKWPLRQILAQYVPKSLIDRPKMGFAVPIDNWLRGPLKLWAESLLELDKLKNEGFFNPDFVQNIWQEHQSKKRNWQYLIWNILMFQAWQYQYSQFIHK